jgi:hypothetical protein
LLKNQVKKKRREEENKEVLEEIRYEKMGPIEKIKFEKEFIKTLIKYKIYEDISDAGKLKITKEEFLKN